MNYILTGHKGLIGDFLKKRLVEEKHNCILNIDSREGFNILNINSLKLNYDTQPVDVFIHTAAHCKINQAIKYPRLTHINNVDGVFECLEFCRENNIKKFIFFSSSRVLSKEKNPYTASKMYGELLCEAYYQCYGIDYIIIRPSTVYGECIDVTSRLITTWVQNALNGKALEIFGDKNKTLDFTYVDDFVDGIILLLDNWEDVKNDGYNISGKNEVNLTYLAKLIIKETKSKSKIVYKDKEIAQPQKIKISIKKMQKYGYSPKIKIEEGVKRLISFYKGEKRKW